MTTDLIEFPALVETRDKLNARRDTLAGIFAEAGPTYDMSLVKSLQGDSNAKVAEIQKLTAEINDLKVDLDKHLVVAKAAGEAKAHADRGERGSAPDAKGDREKKAGKLRPFGQMVVESDAIKGYRPGSGSGPVARLDVDLKTLFSTSNGWDPEDTRTGRVEMYPTRPAPRVIDVFPQTTTSQSTVLYMEETVYENNAAETGEGTQYPEVQLKVDEKSSEVRKIAAFLPVTDEQFEDEERARAYVQNRLPFFLRQRLDSQLLIGNGAAPNLRGLENITGIQSQALGGDPIPDALYKCMRSIRDDGFAEPSHVFIRPSKWESVQLMRTADGVYIWGHPSMPGPRTIWGVPVVESTAGSASKASMGDFTNFSEVAVRRGIDVQISNSHGGFFIEGKLAVRADVRVAVIFYRPKAFGVVTGL
ncbi:phage major capsid protein [Dactylosporangium sp. NPDC000555]|uniref:phage major capsid protein n=1 Tax=Dactylosporangium sp. NPDC000555 TaxID=3154260 RepID=UPI00332A94A3